MNSLEDSKGMAQVVGCIAPVWVLGSRLWLTQPSLLELVDGMFVILILWLSDNFKNQERGLVLWYSRLSLCCGVCILLVQVLGIPLMIQLPANGLESRRGWLRALGHCIHVREPEEAPKSWLWPGPAPAFWGVNQRLLNKYMEDISLLICVSPSCL